MRKKLIPSLVAGSAAAALVAVSLALASQAHEHGAGQTHPSAEAPRTVVAENEDAVNADPGVTDPTGVDAIDLAELTREISLGGEEWLGALGVPDVVAVGIDDESGRMFVGTSADIEPREVVIDGVVFVVSGPASIEWQAGSPPVLT